MNIATLRKWGGAVAVSLPKKVLVTLGLRAGSEVEVKVEEGKIILAPARPKLTLTRLEREQRALERKLGLGRADSDWITGRRYGREEL